MSCTVFYFIFFLRVSFSFFFFFLLFLLLFSRLLIKLYKDWFTRGIKSFNSCFINLCIYDRVSRQKTPQTPPGTQTHPWWTTSVESTFGQLWHSLKTRLQCLTCCRCQIWIHLDTNRRHGKANVVFFLFNNNRFFYLKTWKKKNIQARPVYTY